MYRGLLVGSSFDPKILKAEAGAADAKGDLVVIPGTAVEFITLNFSDPNKVVDGQRSPPLRSADIKHHDGWTRLRATMRGDRIEVHLDGKKYLEVQDATFPEAGKIGLWSKSDARTLFDDLTVTGD